MNFGTKSVYPATQNFTIEIKLMFSDNILLTKKPPNENGHQQKCLIPINSPCYMQKSQVLKGLFYLLKFLYSPTTVVTVLTNKFKQI